MRIKMFMCFLFVCGCSVICVRMCSTNIQQVSYVYMRIVYIFMTRLYVQTRGFRSTTRFTVTIFICNK